MLAKTILFTSCLLLFGGNASATGADEFDTFLKPTVTMYCGKCHGEEEVNGKVNVKEITTARQLLAKPKLIEDLIEVIDANDMPPEEEKQLDEKARTKLLATLRSMLRTATSGQEVKNVRIRRLNRFQYNNSVKDLFELKLDLFPLREKLMTRYDDYLNAKSDKMPDKVHVASHALSPTAGLRGVKAFPKDLRAAHGFDNQANQLTLSPLLLDSFLRLSVSILESPDFNQANVGIWNDLFAQPAAGEEIHAEVKRRLGLFLKKAFRGPVDDATLERYTAYAMSRMKQGLSFTESMKRVASAALSSPLFLYRSGSAGSEKDPFQLASNLSFFLWSSGPDLELLRLAESGTLSHPDVLNKTIERMLSDPKIERFLDTFPAQWMQLENVLAATPDPKKHRLFSLDKNNPASLQMILEPLLLFDAVFIEDRPIIELISPTFGYQSDLLTAWYTTDLKPPKIDPGEVVETNRRNAERRTELETIIERAKATREALLGPVRERLLAAARKDNAGKKPVDLKPYAAWEFDGNLSDSVHSLQLTSNGKIKYEDGMVVLKEAYLQSKMLSFDLKAKTLEVWFKLYDLNQRGGGVMGIQGPGDFFDTIVLGERKPRHWISGSNGFSRTEDFPGSTPEEITGQMLHLAMVYQADGTTLLYRGGKPYGKPFRKGAVTFPKNSTSVIFGLRHLPAGGDKYLNISIDKARLYDRALTAAEIAASHSGDDHYISDKQLLQALTDGQKAKMDALGKTLEQSEAALKGTPQPQDPKKIQQDAQRKFDDEIRGKLRSRLFHRVATTDPRYGGVITNAAMLSMTSGPTRTHPIARGAWIIEVIFNDPPPPPPNDVPPLSEDDGPKNLTIREKFAQHRENPDCASCHARIDPLGFALENFDITGRWRDKYENGRDVDASGKLMRKYEFDGIVRFKESLLKENKRFAKAFTGHLLRFALSRELGPRDSIAIDAIVNKTEKENFRLKALIREIVRSDRFFDRTESKDLRKTGS